jgi:hypothetical protein
MLPSVDAPCQGQVARDGFNSTANAVEWFASNPSWVLYEDVIWQAIREIFNS